MHTICFAVSSDLSFDQRMIRICNSLVRAGYSVTIIGHQKKNSIPLKSEGFKQVRIRTIFDKGILFYAEFNLRLFFKLLFIKTQLLGAIDIDTVIPTYLVSKIRSKKRILDAHEYFSEQKEVVSRKSRYRIWQAIEGFFIPRFPMGYTVSESIAKAFREKFAVNYQVIRNMPLLNISDNLQPQNMDMPRILLYQGAINEARGLENLIPAMNEINAELHLYGTGNFINQTKFLIDSNKLGHKVYIHKPVEPELLRIITANAYLGINLVENLGLNQYYSLANKFFDYMHQGIPQISMNYPEYSKLNKNNKVALLIDDTSRKHIVTAINSILSNRDLYLEMQQACYIARKEFNWQHEEPSLITFYNTQFE